MGNFSYWIEKLDFRKTGMKLFPGTPNVQLDEPYTLPKKIIRLEGSEYGGSVSVNIVPCAILGKSAFILCIDANENGRGHHPRTIIEIATDVKLRDHDWMMVTSWKFRRSTDEYEMTNRHIAYVTLLVRDYDEAKAWYCDVLGFDLIEDTPLEDGKRWLLVAPCGPAGTYLLLATANTDEQEMRVGAQTGGRVFLFLQTDDFWKDFHAMRGKGVRFKENPRQESYGTVAVFEDLYGNLWDLVKLTRMTQA
jgi:catechol 2,3-dioxygenase-like lactoylglutathione lyase family enzyme